MKGLVAAPFTPFTDDGYGVYNKLSNLKTLTYFFLCTSIFSSDLNLPVIGKYADFLCQQGVYNVFGE